MIINYLPDIINLSVCVELSKVIHQRSHAGRKIQHSVYKVAERNFSWKSETMHYNTIYSLVSVCIVYHVCQSMYPLPAHSLPCSLIITDTPSILLSLPLSLHVGRSLLYGHSLPSLPYNTFSLPVKLSYRSAHALLKSTLHADSCVFKLAVVSACRETSYFSSGLDYLSVPTTMWISFIWSALSRVISTTNLQLKCNACIFGVFFLLGMSKYPWKKKETLRF